MSVTSSLAGRGVELGSSRTQRSMSARSGKSEESAGMTDEDEVQGVRDRIQHGQTAAGMTKEAEQHAPLLRNEKPLA